MVSKSIIYESTCHYKETTQVYTNTNSNDRNLLVSTDACGIIMPTKHSAFSYNTQNPCFYFVNTLV